MSSTASGSQGRADVRLTARYHEFYAGAADKLHGETIPYQEAFSVMTWRELLGVAGIIVPWNSPLQISARSMPAALAAGNSVVVKPAEDACLAVVRVFELLEEVGFPAGSINLVTELGKEAGAPLADHADIDHLSFTGSPEVGTLVMKASARHHRPVLLELGGKSPQVVFSDADLHEAIWRPREAAEDGAGLHQHLRRGRRRGTPVRRAQAQRVRSREGP